MQRAGERWGRSVSSRSCPKTELETVVWPTRRSGPRGLQESSRPPAALEVWPQTYGSGKAAIPPNRAAIARRAEPRESQDSPDPPVASRRARSPPSHAKNKNAESRAHPPNSRPPRRRPELSGALATRPTKAEARPGGCDAPTKKNRAGKRRDRRLTAHTDHFLAVEGRATNAE